MKTAISIPTPIFEAADLLAQRLGVSRSELYAKAVSEYLEHSDVCNITEQLNRVYESEPSTFDEVFQEIQYQAIPKEDW